MTVATINIRINRYRNLSLKQQTQLLYQQMDVSVIVPALNEEKYIGPCLKSIASQKTSLKYEIIVCDGKSEDTTRKIARKYADKVIISQVRSVAVQRNTGASDARGKYLLFVDADTLLPPDYIERGVWKFQANPALIGFSASFRFSNPESRLIFAEQVTNSYLQFRDRMGMATLPGFNTFVNAKAFRRLGGFMDVPLEDIDFSYRLRKIGQTRYFADFYVITSSRRLNDMGVLSTLRYYFEMDLARMRPDLKKMLTYNDYVSIRVDSERLNEAFRQMSRPIRRPGRLNASMRLYTRARLTALREAMRNEIADNRMWTRDTMRRLMQDTATVSNALSYIESKKVDIPMIDRALAKVKDRFRWQIRRNIHTRKRKRR